MRTVVEANADDLFRVRQEIDGPITDLEQLRLEVVRYTTNKRGKNGACAFIAKEGDKVYGYVEVELSGASFPARAPAFVNRLKPLAHITRIGVVASLRNKGIGTELTYRAIRWLKTNSARGVWVEYPAKDQAVEMLLHKITFIDDAVFTDDKNERRRIASKTW